MSLDHATPLIEADRIQARVRELATEFATDHQGEEWLLVGALKGCIHFLSDFSRALTLEHTIDFMQVSSYGTEKKSSGIVRILKDLDTNIEGRNVLLIEDIVDTGATLAHLREFLGSRKPAQLCVVALLSKDSARQVQVPVEYVGFSIDDRFVVGYGLDYGERFRNLPYIAALS